MKPLLIALSLLLCGGSLWAQQWSVLNPHDDLFGSTIYSIVADKAGQVYTAGESGDTAHLYLVSTLSNGKWINVGGAHTLRANGTIYALAADSVGNIYAGGAFTDSTGNYFIAKWDGTTWSELGGGPAGVHPNGQIFSLATDKAGNVYAGGELIDSLGKYYIWKWDGHSWAELGMGAHALRANGIVYSIVPDGAGNVYTAGQFTDSSGAYYVAKWNGSDWVEAGSLQAHSWINMLAKDAVGNIYAAGDFKDTAGYRYVAKWDGSSWNEVGSGSAALHANSTIGSIVVDNAGRVDAAGWFTDSIGWMTVWQWTGSAWTEAPVNTWAGNNSILALAADKSGSLFAGGNFIDAQGDHYVAELSGGVWSEPGTYGTKVIAGGNPLKGMAVDTAGHVIVIMGDTDPAGRNMVFRWNGSGWYPALSPAVGLPGTEVNIGGLTPDGLGNIYALGGFPDGGRVCKWSDSGWVELPLWPGDPNSGASAIATDKKGNVYLSAAQYIYKWDGSNWHTYPGSTPGFYYFTVDTAGNIYGSWSDFNWDTYNVDKLAPDGTLTSLGGGPAKHPLDALKWVNAMLFDTAGNLYAGGDFPDSLGNSYVAKWNGQTWARVGAGPAGPNFQDGNINGMVFDNAGNLYASNGEVAGQSTLVGKWDGHTWTSMDSPAWYFTENAMSSISKDKRGRIYVCGQKAVYYYDPPVQAPVIVCDSAAVVSLSASADTVTDSSGPVVLTARGKGTSYLFATDRGFVHTLGAVSADSIATVAVANLTTGANSFYVKMQLTNNCGNVLSAVDSIMVIKTVVSKTDTTSSGQDSLKLTSGPNPFGSSFTVTGLDATKAYVLFIVNSDGVRVYTLPVSGQAAVSVEGLVLKQGIYWLELYDRATGKRAGRLTLLKMP